MTHVLGGNNKMASKKKKTNVQVEATEQIVSEVKVETKIKTGVVTECEKLNVRAKASVESDVVTVITKGTKLTIESFEVGSTWLKVSTESGVKGFVMAKFVTVK